MTQKQDAPEPSVRGVTHQHGEDVPHNHADGDKSHKHSGSESKYSLSETAESVDPERDQS